MATLVFIGLMVFPSEITGLFLSYRADMSAAELASNMFVLNNTPSAMRWVFAATPIIAIQLIGAAYFQAVGKAIPALLLTLNSSRVLLYPLILFSQLFRRTGRLDILSHCRYLIHHCNRILFAKEVKTSLRT